MKEMRKGVFWCTEAEAEKLKSTKNAIQLSTITHPTSGKIYVMQVPPKPKKASTGGGK